MTLSGPAGILPAVTAAPVPRKIDPVVVQALRTEGLVRQLAPVAEGLGIRFALLKGAALHLTRRVRPGERRMSDLDVLLGAQEALQMRDALVARGWRSVDHPRNPQHLPPLLHPRWPTLELHDSVFGLTANGRSFATFGELDAAGALEPLPAFGPAVLVPTRDVLAAHTVVHAFYQHAVEPPFYPNLRAYDDLSALGLLERPEEEFLAGPGRWVWPALSPAQLRTILALGRRLARGEEVAADAPPTPESRLLDHITRRQVDPDYQEALRLNAFRLMVGGPTPVRALLGYAWRFTFITRDQVDSIYGPQKSTWAYAFRRFFRPVDLVLRVGRYSRARLRLRARPASGAAPSGAAPGGGHPTSAG